MTKTKTRRTQDITYVCIIRYTHYIQLSRIITDLVTSTIPINIYNINKEIFYSSLPFVYNT